MVQPAPEWCTLFPATETTLVRYPHGERRHATMAINQEMHDEKIL